MAPRPILLRRIHRRRLGASPLPPHRREDRPLLPSLLRQEKLLRHPPPRRPLLHQNLHGLRQLRRQITLPVLRRLRGRHPRLLLEIPLA